MEASRACNNQLLSFCEWSVWRWQVSWWSNEVVAGKGLTAEEAESLTKGRERLLRIEDDDDDGFMLLQSFFFISCVVV